MLGVSATCMEMSLNGVLMCALNMAEIFVCVQVEVSGHHQNDVQHRSSIALTESFRDTMIRVFGFLPNDVDIVPRIRKLGKAALTDAWQDVPAAGNPADRFFKVSVGLS